MLRWLVKLFDTGYRRGRLKYLLGREADPSMCQVPGVPWHTTDRGLSIICDAFAIPDEQRYCLRPIDRLMAIYKSLNHWLGDDMEFERLLMGIEDAIGCELPEETLARVAETLAGVATVEDVIRLLARSGSRS